LKKHSIFSGIILLGIGSYFLLQQLNISLFTGLFSWSTLVIIIGIALIVQAYSINDHSTIFPGVILIGFGIHFHPLNTLSLWPDHAGMLVLVIAVGLLLRSSKTKANFGEGVLVLAIALLLINYQSFNSWLGGISSGFSFIIRYWPVLLIGVGGYLLFIKKK